MLLKPPHTYYESKYQWRHQMKKHLLASLMLSTVLATSMNAASEATLVVTQAPHHSAASSTFQENTVSKEATASVEVASTQQATWATPQNILIGSGVVAAFLFPKVTFSLMAGYAAYSYFFGAKIEKTAEILTPVKTSSMAVALVDTAKSSESKKDEETGLAGLVKTLPETIELRISGNTFFVNPKIVSAYMQKHDISFEDFQSALENFLKASKKTKKVKAIEAAPSTEKMDAVVVPRLDMSRLNSPLDTEDSHRNMGKDKTARTSHPFGAPHVERLPMDDLELVAVNLTPAEDLVVAEEMMAPASFLSLTKQRGAETREDSPASTTSTIAAVVTPSPEAKKTATKGSVTPRKPVITPRGTISSELLKKSKTPRSQSSFDAKKAAWKM